jgi:hypothetical protein
MTKPRWGRRISHLGQHTEQFLNDYLTEPHRRVLLVAGAGFDPRSTAVARHIAQYAGERARGYFLREERPHPDTSLVARGDQNETALRRLIPDCSVTRLDEVREEQITELVHVWLSGETYVPPCTKDFVK